MKKLIQLFVWLACSLTVIIAAARHSDRTRPTPKAPVLKLNMDTKKGMGTSVEYPTGAAYKLPKGIALNISGTDNKRCQLGAGSLVRLCLAMHNKTREPVTVTLPAGLIFVSRDEKIQNGLLIRDEAFVLAAGETFIFNLALFCLNEDRAVTKAKDKYKIGPVSEDVDIKALIEQLQDKDLEDEHYQAAAQKAIWNITKGFALTAAQHRAIAQIPGI
ncbi:hypothetical protein [Chitinophaga niabensis]|uniref:DUF4384 domain-containing protein n=1 Tax=Chitinophaga niabensis TaxID=536979 RepID=A0A1N6DR36_9BACT|nr:hypothetical protein [Chitinophaga niabensis]SIN73252.1 hypothetical protein SAMN04488055_1011 [Chitinophaga niabensis]